MSDRRRFWLLWKALPRARRWEVNKLAWLGRQASDPETAWFVTQVARGRLRARWFVLVTSLVSVGLVTWAILQTGWHWSMLPYTAQALLWLGADVLGSAPIPVDS